MCADYMCLGSGSFVLVLQRLCDCWQVCTDSSADTVVNPLSPWLLLIMLLGLRLVKPSTFMEAH
jgi:hypothetical protein